MQKVIEVFQCLAIVVRDWFAKLMLLCRGELGESPCRREPPSACKPEPRREPVAKPSNARDDVPPVGVREDE